MVQFWHAFVEKDRLKLIDTAAQVRLHIRAFCEKLESTNNFIRSSAVHVSGGVFRALPAVARTIFRIVSSVFSFVMVLRSDSLKRTWAQLSMFSFENRLLSASR